MPPAAQPYVSSPILDETIRASVNLERFTEGLRRKVARLLNDAQDSLIAEVIRKDPTAVKGTAWRAQRLANLNESVSSILNTNYSKVKRTVASGLKNLAVYEGQNTVTRLNRAIGADLFNVTLTEEGLKAVVSSATIDGATVGEWWNKQNSDFKKKFKRQMADATKQIQMGIVRGEGVGELVRRVKGTALFPGMMKGAKRHADALVRTSVMQVANDARMEMYKGNEDVMEGYEVIATLDTRTTPQCRSRDGLRYDINYKPVGHSMGWVSFPCHWRCRTTTVPWLKSWADLTGPKSKLSKAKIRKIEKMHPGQRAALGGPVRGTFTYDDWLKRQSKAVQLEALGPGRYKLWKANKLSMRDMVHQNGRPLTIKQLEARYGGLGATMDDIAKFKLSTGLDAVGESRMKRLIDPCFM